MLQLKNFSSHLFVTSINFTTPDFTLNVETLGTLFSHKSNPTT